MDDIFHKLWKVSVIRLLNDKYLNYSSMNYFSHSLGVAVDCRCNGWETGICQASGTPVMQPAAVTSNAVKEPVSVQACHILKKHSVRKFING